MKIEGIASLPIRGLGTRLLCLELKNAQLRRRAASGDPAAPSEAAASPPHLTCLQRCIRNSSSLEGDQVRRGVGWGAKGEGCGASLEGWGGKVEG